MLKDGGVGVGGAVGVALEEVGSLSCCVLGSNLLAVDALHRNTSVIYGGVDEIPRQQCDRKNEKETCDGLRWGLAARAAGREMQPWEFRRWKQPSTFVRCKSSPRSSYPSIELVRIRLCSVNTSLTFAAKFAKRRMHVVLHRSRHLLRLRISSQNGTDWSVSRNG